MAKKIVRMHGVNQDSLINKTKTALIKRDIHLGTGKIPAVSYEVFKALGEELGTDSINITIVKERDVIAISKKGASSKSEVILLTDVPMGQTDVYEKGVEARKALIKQRKQSVVNPTE